MIINIGIKEQIAHLMMMSNRPKYRSSLRLLTAECWRSVMQHLVRDTLITTTGWSLPKSSAVHRLDELISYWKGDAVPSRRHLAEIIYCEIVDAVMLELLDEIGPYISPKSIWEQQSYRDHISLHYVGSGPALEKAIRASGGNFESFLHQFF